RMDSVRAGARPRQHERDPAPARSDAALPRQRTAAARARGATDAAAPPEPAKRLLRPRGRGAAGRRPGFAALPARAPRRRLGARLVRRTEEDGPRRRLERPGVRPDHAVAAALISQCSRFAGWRERSQAGVREYGPVGTACFGKGVETDVLRRTR